MSRIETTSSNSRKKPLSWMNRTAIMSLLVQSLLNQEAVGRVVRLVKLEELKLLYSLNWRDARGPSSFEVAIVELRNDLIALVRISSALACDEDLKEGLRLASVAQCR